MLNPYKAYNCGIQCLIHFFIGRFCSESVNHCRSWPCVNGGSCRNLLDDYMCQCPFGEYRQHNRSLALELEQCVSDVSGRSIYCVCVCVCIQHTAFLELPVASSPFLYPLLLLLPLASSSLTSCILFFSHCL